jgi:hypothetical protein
MNNYILPVFAIIIKKCLYSSRNYGKMNLCLQKFFKKNPQGYGMKKNSCCPEGIMKYSGGAAPPSCKRTQTPAVTGIIA